MLRATAVTVLLLIPAAALAAPRDLVVVRPGGPRPSEESTLQVSRLMTEIGVRAGWPEGSTRAFYFNDADAALAHIRADAPGFVLPSPAFLAAHWTELDLAPVNQILIAGSADHRYHVVARRGEVTALGDLAGGTLVGSPLAEPAFVEHVVLADRLPFATVETSYKRALSALRALSKGQVSAVILDEMEHRGLSSLPFADQLETVFTSEALPNPGITALTGVASADDITALRSVTRDFCTAGEGASVCETYQISGFRDAPEGLFAPLLERAGR